MGVISISETITLDTLKRHYNKVSYYSSLVRRIRGINKKLEKDGQNQQLLSVKIQTSKEIEQYKSQIIQAQKVIKSQISYVRKENYREILTMRYIYLFKWQKIEKIFFGNNPDYEDAKHGKYKDKILYWHKRAGKELERASNPLEYQIIKRVQKACRHELKTPTTKTKKEFISYLLSIIK